MKYEERWHVVSLLPKTQFDELAHQLLRIALDHSLGRCGRCPGNFQCETLRLGKSLVLANYSCNTTADDDDNSPTLCRPTVA